VVIAVVTKIRLAASAGTRIGFSRPP
jgi:hypothetical protein